MVYGGNQLWQWRGEEWSMGVTSFGSGERKDGLWVTSYGSGERKDELCRNQFWQWLVEG